jgi:hypothetical protein
VLNAIEARGVLSGKYHGEGKADGGRMFLWLDDLILCVRSCQTIGRRRNSLLPLRMLTASLIAQTETRSDSVAN